MGPGETLVKAAETLRDLSARNKELQNKIAQFESRDRVEKLAFDLSKKGVIAPDEIKTQAQAWLDQNEDIDVLEKAVKIAHSLPEGNWKGTAASTGSASNPEEKIVNFLMGMED